MSSNGGDDESSSTSPSIPGRASAPVGGLTFTEPPQTKTSYYKVAPDNAITFGWNLTSLYSTPDSLTFDAVHTDSDNTYTMGSVGGGESTFEWDPYKYHTENNSPPLVYETYQLRVYDKNGPSAAPAPGTFMPNTNIRFALYKPQSYTPLDEWVCPNCSSAVRSLPLASVAWVVTLSLVLFSGYSVLRGVGGGAGGRR
ncbi:hypothetical protein E3P77_00219 [Wallemia ichthyophaga]|uniref:DUF7137 domain-containing protein n=1 Tax=Wallemia ichthyophaga TaxID=245174 RepID=A0A4T0HK31_WALIC|nr:hypothetical protein E3P91_01865 [Wallemia ichthyophaga]TIA81343.1 hypothetical protein E3P98_02102 [Wallemia ichthyophaga]TIA93097.1 hypothetical protein E3P97_01124 [Wallemia ichthyophaga]TIA99159.1 hypothetical protein E3P96_02962 [Wallemia ichthyophaga]TIB02346.1 hypothetical protein E3P95_00945 [Wallemia ichthyophaga]